MSGGEGEDAFSGKTRKNLRLTDFWERESGNGSFEIEEGFWKKQESGRRKEMILVDIYIPAIDSTYDFMLDENVPIGQIKEEIYEMLLKKVREAKGESGRAFSLWAVSAGRMLEDEDTLYTSGITDGTRMIYV